MGHFDTREPRLIPNLVNTDQVHIQSAVLIGSLLVYSAPCAELKAEWTVIVASSEFFSGPSLGLDLFNPRNRPERHRRPEA
jgi:hypothetical protein